MDYDYGALAHLNWEIQSMQRGSMHKMVSSVGLYMGQPWILRFIRNQGEVTQTQIADALMISPATVANSLKRMNKSGLITRKVDQADTRKNNVVLTAQGESVLSDFEAALRAHEEAMYQGITRKQLDVFKAALEKIKQNLEDMGAEKEFGRRNYGPKGQNGRRGKDIDD